MPKFQSLKLIFSLIIFFYTNSFAVNENPNKTILPSKFKVYVIGKTVSRLPLPGPFPGSKMSILPTVNTYQGYPGCYIVCYSHNKKYSSYPISKNIYVRGQIRIKGKYKGRLCLPIINNKIYLNHQCQSTFPNCKHCWSGNDSGGWFISQHH